MLVDGRSLDDYLTDASQKLTSLSPSHFAPFLREDPRVVSLALLMAIIDLNETIKCK